MGMNSIGFGYFVKTHIMLLPFTNLSTMPHPTKRAADGGIMRVLQAFFWLRAFSALKRIYAHPHAANASRWAVL
jgi:hypothetical protein